MIFPVDESPSQVLFIYVFPVPSKSWTRERTYLRVLEIPSRQPQALSPWSLISCGPTIVYLLDAGPASGFPW